MAKWRAIWAVSSKVKWKAMATGTKSDQQGEISKKSIHVLQYYG